MVIALDTNVIIATLLSWHEHHPRAFAVVDRALRFDRVVLPLPALIEVYSVMTRLPPGSRIAPEQALLLLRGTFGGEGAARAEIVALDGASGWSLLAAAVDRGVAGGGTYDAHVAACALRGRAEQFVTFNAKHFQNLELGSMRIVVPPTLA